MPRARLIGAFAAGALLSPACGVDLNVTVVAPRLLVRVEFTNLHTSVSGSWTGTLESRDPNVPDTVTATTGPVQESALMGDVLGTEEADFPLSPNLYPGKWKITVNVTDAVGPVIDITCRFQVRPDFQGAGGSGVTSTLKLQEGSTECTSAYDAVGEPHVPRRDAAVRSVTAPPAVDQGEVVAVQVVAANNGEARDSFSVRLTDSPPSAGSPGQVTPNPQAVSNLPANTNSPALSFSWNTAGATIGTHTLTASALVPNDAVSANDAQSATVEVRTPPVHDIEVTSVAAAGPLVLGRSYPVTVGVKNNGTVAEVVTATLVDKPPGGGADVPLGTSAPLAVAAQGQANDAVSYTFTWNTASAAPGAHTLKATVAPVPGESVTANNEKAATVTLEQHDVQTLSLTAPAVADVGKPVTATASVRNNGNVDEGAVSVRLSAQTPAGTTITLGTQQVASLPAGQTAPVPFTWDTTCVADGAYTLSATASVADDSNTANDSAAAAPTTLSIDHELSIAFVSPPATVAPGSGVVLRVQLVNNKSVAEANIGVVMTDTPASGPPGSIQADPSLPVSLQCGETKVLVFVWFPSSAIPPPVQHTLTVSIVNAIAGDNPADNSSTASITVQ